MTSQKEKILNSPLLGDEEKRLALCEIRRQRVELQLARHREAKRWEREIREEEERRAKLIRDKQCETSDESDSDSDHSYLSDFSVDSEDSEDSDHSYLSDFGSGE